MKNVFVVIPSLNPDRETLIPLIKSLKEKFEHVIVVDDGSGEKYRKIFNEAKTSGAEVISHYVNLGKGRAMKTATNYILSNYEDVAAIVTADSDGQHTPEDIGRVAKCAIKHKDSYVLGVRDFDKANVPKRSKTGNKLTRKMFKLFVGLTITDTQTGLRGYSKEVGEKLLKVAGERFEYETNTLIACKEEDIPIKEVTIDTIYLNENKSSHFHPIRDSYNIYKLFVKYIIASISSFIVDLVLFHVFMNVFHQNIDAAFYATICARVISSLYNFIINSKIVFQKMTNTSIIKYYALVIIQMFVSAFVVNSLNKILNTDAIIIKVVVDTIIFLVNFVIQREWVFKEKK